MDVARPPVPLTPSPVVRAFVDCFLFGRGRTPGEYVVALRAVLEGLHFLAGTGYDPATKQLYLQGPDAAAAKTYLRRLMARHAGAAEAPPLVVSGMVAGELSKEARRRYDRSEPWLSRVRAKFLPSKLTERRVELDFVSLSHVRA